MANLGTQDMAQYMAANAVRRGDTNMGLGYMLGSMLANAWNRHDTKKQQRKVDAFLDNQKADDIDFSKFGDATTNTLPAGGSIQNQTFDANKVIQPDSTNQVDQYLKDQKVNGFNEYMATAQRTPKPFNPNRMKDFEAWARENNLRDEVAQKGRDRVKREQMEDAEALYMPTIRQGIYGYTDKDKKFHAPDNNSRIQALNALDELVKYSPDKANLYAKLGLAEMSDANKFERNRAAAREDMQAKLSNAVTLANVKGANQVNVKQAGKNGYSPKDVAGAYKAMQTIEGKYVDEMGNPIPSSKWSQLDRDEYMRNKNIYYGGNIPQSPGPRQPQGPSMVDQLNADVDRLMNGKDMGDWNQFQKTADEIKTLLGSKYGMKGDKLDKAMRGLFANNSMAPTYFGDVKPQKAEAPSNNNTFSMSEVNTSKLFNEFISNPQKFRDSHGGMSYSEYIKWLDSEDAKE